MAVLSFAPAISFLTAISQMPPARPIRTLLRTTGHKLSPPKPDVFRPVVRRAQDAVLAAGQAEPRQMAKILYERRKGTTPTIVLGGFVPDATEQVFLLRGMLVRRGSVYYVNYPTSGFSNEILFAQLDDLVTELNEYHGQSPVIFSVSFGAGVAMDWLRRTRLAGRQAAIAGLIIVSPVACAEDLVTPNEPKPSTLLGRAIKPYLDPSKKIDDSVVERSRSIFTKMFEAGAQNQAALRGLMSRRELINLRDAVLGTIKGIGFVGACERIRSLADLHPPTTYFSQSFLPLTSAPTLILYAEKESSVLTDTSPTKAILESAHSAYFTNSECRTVCNPKGSPVQHASLIFHYYNFRPLISAFYRSTEKARLQRVA